MNCVRGCIERAHLVFPRVNLRKFDIESHRTPDRARLNARNPYSPYSLAAQHFQLIQHVERLGSSANLLVPL
jgi:hypothetical protein